MLPSPETNRLYGASPSTCDLKQPAVGSVASIGMGVPSKLACVLGQLLAATSTGSCCATLIGNVVLIAAAPKIGLPAVRVR